MLVSRETEKRLELFEQLFKSWNARINLAAPSTLEDFRRRHIDDSLQVLDLGDLGAEWVDLGSGGGLPGLPIGICLANEDGHIHLVESNRKKTSFLLNCVTQCRAAATVHPVRIEDASERIERADFVTARALAPLDLLIAMAEPWMSRGAIGLFHKGRRYEEEIASARTRFEFDLTVHQSVIDAESVILRIQNPVRL
ncbi:16S rRNA (guanine(527)-N(7))-methyltransferase RsmG [Notoacmeibacter ruber]|uniref:Ribosomal RNA small subunit methyltransferase G n=1 Tax=Notoacmeibacter ruber TaxID=2670375 RepID=A0A3L7JFR2_9HYPH|nr:16S rRNA (guanine(527)-N(7))-methyltransferase RsmG [Notoacmeibacter ruber]RLQ89145.1 16S rRNA (guanine(527)-N(7))-methyltransferase RsmG [Notoacmeibacter ruber]